MYNSDLHYLTHNQKSILKRGGLHTVSDILLVPPQELARKCKISPLDAKAILNAVCENNSPQLRSLAAFSDQELVCSTGDKYLDTALGGGLRTGMVWEVFGQSAAGKTQLALQLSLLVQIPPDLGGLSASACYITVSSKLPTQRLLQLVEAHPLLSQEICSLEGISSIKTPTIPMLIHVLSKILPELIVQKAESKPVRLVVIDALAELFHSSDKTSTSTLVERSQNITEISALLHALANSQNIAVLVLNEVSDVFDYQGETSTDGELIYNQQSRWFGGADTVAGEANKEASLGLVWANQVNARIMLSRTGRRRYLEDGPHNKRQKADDRLPSVPPNHRDDDAVLVRRLSVVFSSVGPPCSRDYVVTTAGISLLPDDEDVLLEPSSSNPRSNTLLPTGMPGSQVAPLDIGFAEHETQSEALRAAEDEEWENYWNTDDIPLEMYNGIEFDTGE